MTTAEIDRLLARARRDLAEAEKAAANIEWLRASIIQLEAMRDEAKRRLHSGNSSSTVDAMMATDHRLAIAKGRASAKDAAFAKAAQAKGYSMTTLAAALGVHKSALSRWRSGDREVPSAIREKVHTLIGWPANRWPKLGE
ncbi:MAG TPA: helix-turn-helix domain-containing protein [Candidatus Dormibacteraeota bacterium]